MARLGMVGLALLGALFLSASAAMAQGGDLVVGTR
jgi:hypothetical protein